jgi:hypothetical protein
MADVIRMLSFRAHRTLPVIAVICALAHAACGFGQEPVRPQPASGSYEIIQGRMKIDDVETTLSGARISPIFFKSIGQHPLIGRFIADADGAPTATPVIVLHHTLWKEKFGASPEIIGRTVELDGRAFTVFQRAGRRAVLGAETSCRGMTTRSAPASRRSKF